MATILTFLVILLLITSFFLLKLIIPPGAVATKADTGGLTWVRSIYGWGKLKSQQLTSAATVAFAQDGTILVPDVAQKPQVLRFAGDGSYRGTFAGGQKGRIIFPTAINVGPDGRIYVVQGPRSIVTVLQPNGQDVVGEIRVEKPAAVAASKDRIVIGSEAGIAILDQDAVLLKLIGSRGKGDNQFDQVGGVAIDDKDNVYAVDTYNNRISKYDATGKRLWLVRTGPPNNQEKLRGGNSLSQETTGVGNVQLPIAATLDGKNRLVVIDSFDFTLAVFDTKDGSFVGKYGKFGSSEGEFSYPTGITYDRARDWFAVADTGNGRVQIVQIPGSGSDRVAPFRASMSGPVRACAAPLILLLVVLILWMVTRRRRSRTAPPDQGAVAGAE